MESVDNNGNFVFSPLTHFTGGYKSTPHPQKREAQRCGAGYLNGQAATFLACWRFGRCSSFINLSVLILFEPMRVFFFSSV